MSEKKNIIIVGGAFAGLSAAHYFLRHVAPFLSSKGGYHLRIIDPSDDFMFRVAAPRAIAAPDLMPTSKFFFPIADAFKQYDSKLYDIIRGRAISLDLSARTITLKIEDSKLATQTIPYHALIIATGTRTASPLFSIGSGRESVEKALAGIHKRLQSAKTVVIAGGGPTGVETAGEIGETLNGIPRFLSLSAKEPRVQITLLSGSDRILPDLRSAIATQAEEYLSRVGVKVTHKKRVASHAKNDDGTSTISLDNGETIVSDVYIEALGVKPNTEWLPTSILNKTGYVKTNKVSLRVDDAGPRVYALGDVGSYTRSGIMDMFDAVPVALSNMKQDILAAETLGQGNTTVAKDRVYKPNLTETQLVPIGLSKGVGAYRGWRLSSFLVWLFKGRHYLTSTVAVELYTGSKWGKES